MNSRKKWIKVWVFTILLIPVVACINYIIDPYGIFNSWIVDLPKREQINKVRLVKVNYLRRLQPTSLILGTSRAEVTFNPSHKYFLQPSFNAATSGSSLYENLKYLELALESGKLKQVLLVVDYFMFTGIPRKREVEFDTYFNKNFNIKKYLFNINTLKSSIRTITKQNKPFFMYRKNGEKISSINKIKTKINPMLSMIEIEKNFYKGYQKEYKYKNSQVSPMDDFIKILEICYRKKINLQIIFGPSHIRLWESLDYYLGIESWYKWKYDIVKKVKEVASKEKKVPFSIKDFSIYNQYTGEKVFFNKPLIYHIESSHYSKKLSNLVLEALSNSKNVKNLYKEINVQNIEEHINRQDILRNQFINIKEYRENLIKELEK